ncbi:hypothetical protein MKW98_007227 [Papaver atlanticum]|uniref:Uncharacterized protein n=1 Tax=Papaver atlanticum TaxID=357466 RepID=A0AAD4SMS5_9MAGN|nr:hypothetical protein MKW98_007227 [Papaver atlanticum]
MHVLISKRRMQPAVVLGLFLLIGFNLLINISSVCSSIDTHEVNKLNYIELNNVAARKLLRTMSKPPSPQANRQRLWENPPGPPEEI